MSNTDYMGHNIGYVNLSDFTNPPDEYFEFLCLGSETISRVAVNKVQRKIAVIYASSPTVYEYDDVSLLRIGQLEQNTSKEEVMTEVQKECPSVHTLEVFPSAVLTNINRLLTSN